MIILLMLLGLIPFAAGYGLKFVPVMTEGYLAYVTAVLFLIIWFFVTKLGKIMCRKLFKTVWDINLVGFLDLLVILAQLLITKGFWTNVVGEWSQYYFEPLKVFGIQVAQHMPPEYYSLWIYIFCFLLMVIVSLLASIFTKVKKKDKNSNDGSGLAALAKKAEESTASLNAGNDNQ